MRADLVVLEGDPASDVLNFARVRYRKVLAHLGVMWRSLDVEVDFP